MIRKVWAVSAVLVAVLLLSGTAFAGEKTTNPVFMKEFAGFVKDRIESEPRIRVILRDYINKNKEKIREGFGLHPELIPGMYEAAGVEKLNCVQGRYADVLNEKLNNEERLLFYDVAHKVDWWVMNVALEEAVKGGVFNPQQPLAYRMPMDVPYFVAVSISKAILPYIDKKSVTSAPGVFGFNSLDCN